MVGWRNPARYLAPLAIAAVAAAAYVIVHSALADKHTAASLTIVQPTTTTTRARHKVSKARFYVVRPNDTLSKISARTGVSLSTLEALNPNVSPDSLHPQQRLKLRR
ncbi:MAG: LysM peptidoglycan-binding domain-containing protein [Solirubrobacterales bacterium]|nr:LysM peptidoglycan-binding domain-containing protein [Solirubrobacterales bacterium]